MKKVFITGISGFIGFHLASALKKLGYFVIGIDSFNSYYDVTLKYARQKILEEQGIEVISANICDTPFISKLLKTHEITHCVHLAAQAGVRYSFDHPQEYVSSNLDGFVSTLEACRKIPSIKLVFASSSSVYGLNSKIPFGENDPTDRPSNLYGATKKSNEALAFSYHHLYEIPMVGLRYFTVYGPWGRPDMAYFHFTKCILEGKSIQLFNHGKMKRDFTYIDDIIDGTIRAMDVEKGFEIYNLGNCEPVGLFEFVDCLEASLGKKAFKELKPLQPGELLETYADISKAKNDFGFSPKITLREGIDQFVSWYLNYYDRNAQELCNRSSIAP